MTTTITPEDLERLKSLVLGEWREGDWGAGVRLSSSGQWGLVELHVFHIAGRRWMARLDYEGNTQTKTIEAQPVDAMLALLRESLVVSILHGLNAFPEVPEPNDPEWPFWFARFDLEGETRWAYLSTERARHMSIKAYRRAPPWPNWKPEEKG